VGITVALNNSDATRIADENRCDLRSKLERKAQALPIEWKTRFHHS
jgi:hypothetical protein